MKGTRQGFVYPPGHNWEGLTPSQVNEGYGMESEKTQLQQVMKDEPGKEVRLEILGQENSNEE